MKTAKKINATTIKIKESINIYIYIYRYIYILLLLLFYTIIINFLIILYILLY